MPSRVVRLVEFVFRRSDASGDIYPDGPGAGSIEGREPERVVFLGERGQLDLGVRSHDLGLPAFFARHLATLSGRGVEWSTHPFPRARLEDAPRVIRGDDCDLRDADAVVLVIGITDALRVMTASAWQQHMADALDSLQVRLRPDARIVISDIPPLDNAGSLSRPARIAAGLHGRALNKHTRAAAQCFDRVTVVPFPEELTSSLWRPESEEARYTHTYRVWGRHLAAALALQSPR